MKLDDLKPCARCNGPLGFAFVWLTEEVHQVDPLAASQRVGLGMMFPGAPMLASVFDPSGDAATKVVHFETSLLCMNCHMEFLWWMGRRAAKGEERTT